MYTCHIFNKKQKVRQKKTKNKTKKENKTKKNKIKKLTLQYICSSILSTMFNKINNIYLTGFRYQLNNCLYCMHTNKIFWHIIITSFFVEKYKANKIF